jgi:1,4-alpha-glucan branching enzyme
MPPVEIWTQFAIVAICVLVIGIFLRFQSDEAEKQRVWQEKMAAARDLEQTKRDAMWREYFQSLQVQQAATADAQAKTLSKLICAVEDLQRVVNHHSEVLVQHDIRAEQFIDETRISLDRLRR